MIYSCTCLFCVKILVIGSDTALNKGTELSSDIVASVPSEIPYGENASLNYRITESQTGSYTEATCPFNRWVFF